jgi:hypothetical protein
MTEKLKTKTVAKTANPVPDTTASKQAALGFVAQLMTASSFPLGAAKSWDMSVLEMYALGIIAQGSATGDAAEDITSIIRRNHVDVNYGQVCAAVGSLRKRHLVIMKKSKAITTEYGGPAEIYSLSVSGRRNLESIASNVRSDLGGYNQKVKEGLEALAYS